MSSFTDELDVRIQADGIQGELLSEFDYHVGAECSPDIIHVPKGFKTDFASVPEITTPIILLCTVCVYMAGVYWGLEWLKITAVSLSFALNLLSIFRKNGKHSKAAIIHDYLYQSKLRSRAMADLIFKEAMIVLGVERWRADLEYIGVRCFGWLGYSKNNLTDRK